MRTFLAWGTTDSIFLVTISTKTSLAFRLSDGSSRSMSDSSSFLTLDLATLFRALRLKTVLWSFVSTFEVSYSSSMDVAGVSAPPITEVWLLELLVVTEDTSGELTSAATIFDARPRRLRLGAGIVLGGQDERKRQRRQRHKRQGRLPICHAFSGGRVTSTSGHIRIVFVYWRASAPWIWFRLRLRPETKPHG